MNQEKLELLLRQTAPVGFRASPAPGCLDIRTILALLDRSGEMDAKTLRHLATCAHCQWAVALARRERSLIEAPLSQRPEEDEDEDSKAVSTPQQGPSVDPSGRMSRSILLRWVPVSAGIAAVVVLAVGLRWWVTPPTLIGPITGQFELRSGTRGDEGPKREYEITFELRSEAHMIFLYLDQTRELKLPDGASRQADLLPPRFHSYVADITGDPPGPQWIAAVASKQNFDPIALREELQSKTKALPEGASFEEVIAKLEQALGTRTDLTFRGHSFEVGTGEAP